VSAAVAQFANAPTSIKRAVLDNAGAPVPDAAGKTAPWLSSFPAEKP